MSGLDVTLRMDRHVALAGIRHFIDEAQRQAASIYGRKMYEVMRYWPPLRLKTRDRIGENVIRLAHVPA